jgi:uncharacterized caspase-like protein/Tfp pilus assembly protein PilF
MAQPTTERDLKFERTAEVLKGLRIARSYALVIGINEYKNLAKEHWLRFAESDAEAIYDVMISAEGGNIPPQNVKRLIGAQATREEIRKAVEDWLPSVSQDADRVIVFFAGHGVVSGGRGYLAPYDLNPKSPDSAYSMEALGNVLANKVRARWKVLLADACHSGKISASSSEEAINDAFSKLPGDFLTLTATREREKSYEDPTLGSGSGLFTYFLVKGWKGEADLPPSDGIVTADELCEFVRRRVREFARSRNALQTPTERGDFDVNMVLGFNPSRRAGQAEAVETGELVIDANTDAVEVYVDEVRAGLVKIGEQLRLPGQASGYHVVKGIKMGYEPDIRRVLVAPGRQTAVTLRIQYAKQRKKSAENHFEKGMELYSKAKDDGGLDRAANRLKQALSEDPSYSQAAYYYCLVAQLLNRIDDAMSACKSAVESDPDYVEARIQYGAVLADSGDTDEAVRQLTLAMRQNPKNSLALSHAAQSFRVAGAYKLGVEAADRALNADPDNAQAYLWRGDNRRLLLRWNDAIGDYERYLQLTEFEAGWAERVTFWFGHGATKRRPSQRQVHAAQRNLAYFGLCNCEQQLGNLTRALFLCSKALRYDSDDPYVWYMLGHVHRDLYNAFSSRRDLESAREQYARVVSNYPDLEYSKSARQYVEQIDRVLAKLTPR